MSDYVIMTDSSCDLPAQLAQELELVVLPLSVLVDGQVYNNLLDGSEISFKDVYAKLRGGMNIKTSAVNIGAFQEAMEPILEAGKDILYLGFSSGLSAAYASGATAAAEMQKRFPGRKIFAVDTLSASLGQGLLVYHTVEQKRNGATIEEARDYALDARFHQCHWFTVDDLNFLKRGGRVSAGAALMGTALNIKPVMHMDDAGHLIPVGKVRGRKRSLEALVDHMQELAISPANQTVFISHGDCEEDANWLAGLVKERLGVKEVLVNYVGPVIGSHSGPGTMALFFVGEHR